MKQKSFNFSKNQKMACLSLIPAVILAIQFIAKVLPWIYETFIGPYILGPKLKLRNYGEWALVTGATDGIGKSYAKQLAKEGLKIILISRTQEKLDSVAKEIENEFKVETKTIAINFADEAEIYDKIDAEIKGYNIGVLVNNVGVSYSYPEFFLDVANRDVVFHHIIRCNITSVVSMTKIVLPRMLSSQKGIILNIASMSGTIPQPLLAVYSASKAFVDKLSEDLNTEYGSQGIIVQSVLPGFVVTNMTKIRRSSLFVPSSDDYVSHAIQTIGYAKHTTGYWPHALMQIVLTTAHAYLPDLANSLTLNAMKNLKRKSLKLNQKFEEKKKMETKSQ